jgi:hypothetical protein
VFNAQKEAVKQKRKMLFNGGSSCRHFAHYLIFLRLLLAGFPLQLLPKGLLRVLAMRASHTLAVSSKA